MHRFAGILFQMQALDTDFDISEFAILVRADGHGNDALSDDRILELADLIALGEIRIEIVLAVKDGALVDLRLQPKAGADRLANAFLVDDGKHAGHGRVDEADMGIGLGAETRRGA